MRCVRGEASATALCSVCTGYTCSATALPAVCAAVRCCSAASCCLPLACTLCGGGLCPPGCCCPVWCTWMGRPGVPAVCMVGAGCRVSPLLLVVLWWADLWPRWHGCDGRHNLCVGPGHGSLVRGYYVVCASSVWRPTLPPLYPLRTPEEWYPARRRSAAGSPSTTLAKKSIAPRNCAPCHRVPVGLAGSPSLTDRW